MAINLNKLTGFHHNAVNIRNESMEVIANNLANANTPGFKAKGMNFQRAMERANRQMGGQELAKTHSKHIDGHASSFSLDIQYRVPDQPDTGDGNTVDVQEERNAFLDTGLRYQASLQFLDGKLKGMKKALTGGGGR